MSIIIFFKCLPTPNFGVFQLKSSNSSKNPNQQKNSQEFPFTKFFKFTSLDRLRRNAPAKVAPLFTTHTLPLSAPCPLIHKHNGVRTHTHSLCCGNTNSSCARRGKRTIKRRENTHYSLSRSLPRLLRFLRDLSTSGTPTIFSLFSLQEVCFLFIQNFNTFSCHHPSRGPSTNEATLNFFSVCNCQQWRKLLSKIN